MLHVTDNNVTLPLHATPLYRENPGRQTRSFILSKGYVIKISGMQDILPVRHIS
jgi:hypothetical protein